MLSEQLQKLANGKCSTILGGMNNEY